jgi:hypothetical protein
VRFGLRPLELEKLGRTRDDTGTRRRHVDVQPLGPTC